MVGASKKWGYLPQKFEVVEYLASFPSKPANLRRPHETDTVWWADWCPGKARKASGLPCGPLLGVWTWNLPSVVVRPHRKANAAVLGVHHECTVFSTHAGTRLPFILVVR